MSRAAGAGSSAMSSVRPILVQLPNWIGDAVISVPAIRSLQAARAGVALILCGNERSVPLFGRFPAQALLRLDRKDIGAVARLARRLRRHEIAEALVLGPSFRAVLPGFLGGARRLAGFSGEGRSLLLTDPVARPSRRRHLALDYLEAAARLGADPHAPLDPRLPVGEDELASARASLESRGIAWTTAIALAPGASFGETKRWPARHWIALGRALVASGRPVILLGGASEKELCAEIAHAIGQGADSMAGETGLRAALSILASVALAVSNDSGLMHLATAAGCPVVGIFGSTDPVWTGPLGGRSRVLHLGLPCSPCYSPRCPTQIECLRDISPQSVLEEIGRILDEKGESGG